MHNTANYNRYVYFLSKELATVLHFECISGKGKGPFTEKIKFSKDRGFSQASGVLFWLHLREDSKWSKPLTGLRPFADLQYYGDIMISGKKSLLIFLFDETKGTLVVDVYKGFYPSYKGLLNIILESQSLGL